LLGGQFLCWLCKDTVKEEVGKQVLNAYEIYQALQRKFKHVFKDIQEDSLFSRNPKLVLVHNHQLI
jgi:hypothetical protein